MKRTLGVAITATVLPLALLVASQSVWAATDGPLNPQAQATAKPKPRNLPTVNVSEDKEGASATARDTERLNVSKPKRPTTTRQTRKPSATRPTRPAPSSKEDSGDDSTDRTDLKLNIGICGRRQTDGTIPGPNRCEPDVDDRRVTFRTIPPVIVRPRPEDVTWEQVRSETKNIAFPGLAVKVQPKDRTLVNLDTIVYTDESKVSTTTVTLLGFPVVVQATPVSYTWRFGDGSPALTTSTPGKPYPSKEITHKYMKRGNVSLTLTTNYAARFNVADTGWQYIEGTVPITGPATALQIREAIPVLVDPDR